MMIICLVLVDSYQEYTPTFLPFAHLSILNIDKQYAELTNCEVL